MLKLFDRAMLSQDTCNQNGIYRAATTGGGRDCRRMQRLPERGMAVNIQRVGCGMMGEEMFCNPGLAEYRRVVKWSVTGNICGVGICAMLQ